jgi:F-type H+-transporting ATPase subunit delta
VIAGQAERRYAEALLGSAPPEALDVLERQASELVALLSASPELRRALRHPRVAPDEKRRVLRRVAPDLHPLLGRFFDLLLAKGREGELAEMLAAFLRRLAEQEGRVQAEVASAVPLGEEDRERLRAALAARFRRKIDLEVRVDRSLIGGVRVRVGDQVIDASLAGKLERLRRRLRSSTRVVQALADAG